MRFDRFGAIDTKLEDENRYWEFMRKKTPEEKFRMVVAHMKLGRRLKEVGDELRKTKE